MKHNNANAISWFSIGTILLILGIVIGQIPITALGIFLIIIGMWYWLKDPYEPKCGECGFINREGAKICQSCNAKIKEKHTARNNGIGAIIGLIIGGLIVAWVFNFACNEMGRCL